MNPLERGLVRTYIAEFLGLVATGLGLHRDHPDACFGSSRDGIGQVPGFDLGKADLVMSFGLDLFEDGSAPLHAISSVVGSRATEERAALLYAGTRLSSGSSKAEIYVPIEPGTHGALALGVAHVLVREGNYDKAFVAEHTFGFDDWGDDRGRERLGFRRLGVFVARSHCAERDRLRPV